MTIYGQFDKQDGIEAHSFLPIMHTYRIIGVTKVDECSSKQIEVEHNGELKTLTELPKNIIWSKDFKDLNIENIDDLDFEIRNKKNRKKYLNYKKAILFLENKECCIGLVDSNIIDFINNGLKMLQIIDENEIYYINTNKILKIKSLKKGE